LRLLRDQRNVSGRNRHCPIISKEVYRSHPLFTESMSVNTTMSDDIWFYSDEIGGWTNPLEFLCFLSLLKLVRFSNGLEKLIRCLIIGSSYHKSDSR
jgi:hypothetical protein